MFMAINERIECLHILYGKLETNNTIPPPVKVMWPNPTANPPRPQSSEWSQGPESFARLGGLLDMPANPINEKNKRHGIYPSRMRAEGDALTMGIWVKYATKYAVMQSLIDMVCSLATIPHHGPTFV